MALANPDNFPRFQNPEEVLKALRSEDGGGIDGIFHSGGSLDPQQQRQFVESIRAYGVMLAPLVDMQEFPDDSPIGAAAVPGSPPALVPGGCRVETHSDGAVSGTYDSLYVGNTITRGASVDGNNRYVQEGLQDAGVAGHIGNLDGNYDQPDMVKHGRNEYHLTKFRSSWSPTTELLVRSILQGAEAYNSTLTRLFGKRMAHDFEDVGINGDTDITARFARDLLLRTNDGWLKKSKNEGRVSAQGGDYLTFDAAIDAIRRLPPEAEQAGLRWWMHPNVTLDWVQRLYTESLTSDTSRDQAMMGRFMSLVGLPIVKVPQLPFTEALPVGAVEPASHLGSIGGPFSFAPTRKTISIAINGGGAVNVVFPDWEAADQTTRLQRIHQVVAHINTAVGATVCRESQHGTLEFFSGAVNGNTLDVADVDVGTLADLGFRGPLAQLVTGAAAAARAGTSIWLSKPDNFVAHISTAEPGANGMGLRIYQKFQQEEDRFKNDVYSWWDFTLDRPEHMVTLTEVRVMKPGQANPF